MTSNQLPEEKQMELLLSYLRDKEDFQSMRGEMSNGWNNGIQTDFFLELIKKSKNNPTQFLKLFNAYVKKMRFIGNTLAKLTRDGHGVAVEEMIHALQSSNHLMKGEVLSTTEMVTVTIAIPSFDLCLPYIKYQRTARNLGHIDDNTTTNETEKLVKEFLSQFEANLSNAYRPWNFTLFDRHYANIARPFWRYFKDSSIVYEKLLMSKLVCHSAFHYTNRPVFGLIFKSSKKNVLKHIPREKQKSTGLWEIQIPQRIAIDKVDPSKRDNKIIDGFAICFYPEKDSDIWQKKVNTFHAPNAQFGFRAFIQPGIGFDEEFVEHYNKERLGGNIGQRAKVHSPNEDFVFILC